LRSDSRFANFRWLIVALLVVALDQFSKFEASHRLEFGVPKPVIGGFNLTLMHNPGAAFSLFASGDGWQRWLFTGIALVVSLWLLRMLLLAPPGARWLPASLMLVMGGAIGNLWDRLALGCVIDFIQVCYANWCFPAFNIADSAITVGAVMLVLETFLESSTHSAGARPD
jgi:signal peptidase II